MYSFTQHIAKSIALCMSLLMAPAMVLADAENPVKLWTVEGLKNPESAVFDYDKKVIYVSNVDGDATAKDGKGFISKISRDGKILKLRWVEGMNGPKGMAISNGYLFVADIDKLVVIDMAKEEIWRTYETMGAQFLNDVVAGADGTVYVSDMFTNTIHQWKNEKWTVFMQDEGLNKPNGLWHGGEHLFVASWGNNAMDTTGSGGVIAVKIADKSINQFSNKNFGHLDGLEKDLDGDFYVTDWVAGLLYHVELDGHHDLIMKLSPGSADIGYISGQNILLIPMMKDNIMHAYNMHGPEEDDDHDDDHDDHDDHHGHDDHHH